MKEYLKNKNEYIEDGRRYIENIKLCICDSQFDGEYLLFCDIHQRGSKYYTYGKNSGKIIRYPYGEKSFYLSENAEKIVLEAVGFFEKNIDSVKNEDGVKVEIKELNLNLYYKQLSGSLFGFVEEYKDKQSRKVVSYRSRDIKEELHSLPCGAYFHYFYGEGAEKMIEILKKSDEHTINKNPLYLSALKSGNTFLQKQIKLFYNLATVEECEQIEEVTGERILPKLPEKFNMGYVVKRKGVDISLLSRSGYEILHRPYFAMMNSTHSIITLNPHTKTGVDAAAFYEEPITFDEFLKLFEEAENDG